MLVLLGAACSAPASPVEEIRWPIDPPTLYQDFWGDVQKCSGLVAPFTRIRWFGTRIFPENSFILGQWNDRHEITLRSDSWTEPGVVKHEILHDLLDGDPTHDEIAWTLCSLPIGIG